MTCTAARFKSAHSCDLISTDHRMSSVSNVAFLNSPADTQQSHQGEFESCSVKQDLPVVAD